MEMMDLDKLPDPFSLPFQDHSNSPITHQTFSGQNPTTNHHEQPPPAPLFRNSGDFPRASWLQKKPDSVEAMREMIFRMAALQPVQIDPESVKPPKRRNVKISKDPQSVAARHRRERISERIRILQRLVPGGTKMDTASMLDEAVHYMKFLKKQVQMLEQAASGGLTEATGMGFCPTTAGNYHGGIQYTNNVIRACGEPAAHMLGSMELLK